MKAVIVITGPPGIGKSTVLNKTVDTLRQRGFSVGGMLSLEVRNDGVRVGFKIQDLSSEQSGWLAHINQPSGPKIGKYRVNLADLDAFGAHAITNAVVRSDIVVIDEVGPMELFSEKFRDAVETALKSPKTVIAVVHWKAKDELIDNMRAHKESQIFMVTPENRDSLDRTISEKAIQ